MRLVVPLFGIAVAVAIVAACAGDDPSDGPPILDGGEDAPPLDAMIVGDGAASDSGPIDPPPGDVCGDAGGLQTGAPWPLQGGCPTRAGHSSIRGPQGARVRVLASLAGSESAPAIAANGTLWIGSADGTVYAIASGGGTILRRRQLPAPVRATPAIDAAGRAIVAGTDALYAFDLNEPEDAGTADAGDAGAALTNIVFRTPLSAPAVGSPVIAPNGTIYVATTDGKLSAYSATGTFQWSAPTGDTFGSSPALGQNGTIYVGSTDRALHAINPDGTTRWKLDVGAEIKASPAVGGDGSVYVGAVDGKLHSVTADGTRRWSYAAEGAFTGTPAVYAGTVYAGAEDKKLHAVSTVDGSGRWQYATFGTVRTPIITSGGEIYVGSSDGRLYAVTSKGSLFFAVVAKGPVTSAPAIIGSAIYVATANGIAVLGP